jgi:pimeloyl-ACP methyl ester carboxylesterase
MCRDAARAVKRMSARVIDTGAVRLHLTEAGEGPPVLFLHGFPEYSGTWARQVAALSPRYRCIAPDQRGYARSDKPAGAAAYAVPELLADIDGLLDALGIAQLALVGHDWGGVLAWWYAATRPERVRCVAVLNAPHPVAFQKRLLTDPAQRAASAYFERLRAADAETSFAARGPQGLWEALFAKNPAFDAATRDGFLAAWGQPDALAAPLRWYQASPFRLDRADWHLGDALRVTVPALAIWGMRDTVFVAENLDDLENEVEGLEVVRIAAAGHAPQHDAADEVSAALARFLEDHLD